MKKTLLLIILFLGTFSGWACLCPPPGRLDDARQIEIQSSDIIVIADVLEINKTDHTFKVRVIEVFKGKTKKGEIMIIKNWRFCEPNVDKNGKWLIYSSIIDGSLYVNDCGLTRSFRHPENNSHFFIPRIPPFNISKSRLIRFDKRGIRRIKRIAPRMLKKEVALLRRIASS